MSICFSLNFSLIKTDVNGVAKILHFNEAKDELLHQYDLHEHVLKQFLKIFFFINNKSWIWIN